MAAGALRESVTFQRRGPVDDGYGNTATGDWTNIPNAVGLPANLTPLRYGETVIAEGVQGRRVYLVELRYVDVLLGLLVTDRMIDARSGVAYSVKSPPVNKDKKRKYLELFVETGGATG